MAHLDRAACRERRRADDRGDLAGADRRHAAGDGRAAAGHRGSARGGAAARASEAQQLRAGHRQRSGAQRVERRERAADAAQRGAVLAAALAAAHVAARAPRGLDAAVVARGQVVADLGAVGVARLSGLDEPDPRPHQQRLDGRHRDVERPGEVGVRHAVYLAHQQGRALVLGQPPDVLHELGQVLAPLRLLERVVQRLARDLEHVGRRWDGPAHVVDAAVVGDAVEPGADVDVALIGPQRSVRAYEDVLQHVLGVLARSRAHHLPDVGEQPLAVAVVDDAEGLLAAGPEEREQLLVRAQAKQRRAERQSRESHRCVNC
jgi:hypothetical protein